MKIQLALPVVLMVALVLMVGCGRAGYEGFAIDQLGSVGDGSVPHPAPQLRSSSYEPVAENQRCVKCHRVIAAEWQASLHRKSFTDPIFFVGVCCRAARFLQKLSCSGASELGRRHYA